MQPEKQGSSALNGPITNQKFSTSLDELVAIAKKGHPKDSEFFNPSDQWILDQVRVFQNLPEADRNTFLEQAEELNKQAELLTLKLPAKPAPLAGPTTWPGPKRWRECPPHWLFAHFRQLPSHGHGSLWQDQFKRHNGSSASPILKSSCAYNSRSSCAARKIAYSW